MTEKIVQLVDKDNNNLYPVAGSLKQGSVTTSTINDKAVTAAKVDFSTFNNGLYVTRVVLDIPIESDATRQITTTKGNTLALFSAGAGTGIGVDGGGGDIIKLDEDSTFVLSSSTTGDIGVSGLSTTSRPSSCGYRFANSSSGGGINFEGTNEDSTPTPTPVNFGTALSTGGGAKSRVSIKSSWRRSGTNSTFWIGKWGYNAFGSISSFDGWTELYSMSSSIVPTVYLRYANGLVSSGKVILTIYEI